MILAIIITCEVGFWVLILFGLVARYPLKMHDLGLVLLALTPVVDIVLLAATAVDLSRGSTATIFHGLAAIYLGFSVAYGHKMIKWADSHFAYRFAAGPTPRKRYGADYMSECWRDAARTLLAAAIAAGVLWGLIVISGDPAHSSALEGMFRILGLIVAVELIWATGYTIWPKKAPVKAT